MTTQPTSSQSSKRKRQKNFNQTTGRVLKRRLETTVAKTIEKFPKFFVDSHGGTYTRKTYQLPPKVVVIFFTEIGHPTYSKLITMLLQHPEFVHQVLRGNPEPIYQGIKAFTSMHVPGDTIHDMSLDFRDTHYQRGVFPVPVPREPGLIHDAETVETNKQSMDYTRLAGALHTVGPFHPHKINLSQLIGIFGNRGVFLVHGCRNIRNGNRQVTPRMKWNQAISYGRQLGSNIPRQVQTTRGQHKGNLVPFVYNGLFGNFMVKPAYTKIEVLGMLAGLKKCLDVVRYSDTGMWKLVALPFKLEREFWGYTTLSFSRFEFRFNKRKQLTSIEIDRDYVLLSKPCPLVRSSLHDVVDFVQRHVPPGIFQTLFLEMKQYLSST